MLVVTVEVWPGGKERHKRVIARAGIANDRTGTEEAGNYNAVFSGAASGRETVRVEGFQRKKRDGWWLVFAALAEVIGKRMSAELSQPLESPAETVTGAPV